MTDTDVSGPVGRRVRGRGGIIRWVVDPAPATPSTDDRPTPTELAGLAAIHAECLAEMLAARAANSPHATELAALAVRHAEIKAARA